MAPALRGFASLFKIDIGGVEISIDAEPVPGLADSGDLQYDLPDLFEVIGRAAQDVGRGWILLIDEVRYVSQKALAALIVAIHHVTREGLPVLLIGAGLPQAARFGGDAEFCAERLILFPALGPLSPKDAALVIQKPILDENASIDAKALDLIVERTGGGIIFLAATGL